MTQYNGHRSWNCWNVSLWISNDEGLYRTALSYLDNAKTVAVAARRMARDFAGERTPDGGKYNYTAIYHAIAGLRD